MMFIKKISAVLLAITLILSGIPVTFAATPTVSLEGSADVDATYLIATSDKYIFAATGTSKLLAYEIKVIDKKSLKLLTTITHKSPSTVNLRVQAIHVKGDYLYAAFVQRAGNGNPCILKYKIKDIHEGKVMTPVFGVGARPNAFSYIDDNIFCRTDSGYGNISFMDTENLTDISAIGVSDENKVALEGYKGLYIHNNFLYAHATRTIYVYDVSAPLNGVSKSDSQVFKGTTTLSGTVNMIRGYGNYVYVATSRGLVVLEMTNDGTIKTKTVTTANLDSMEINNGYLYLSEGSKLKIYDLQSPLSPTLVYTSGSGYKFNYIHLRPGKMYAGTSTGVSVYNVSGIEITETITPGTEETVKAITYRKNLEGIEGITDICAEDNYLFALTGSNVINVVRSDTLEKVTEIYKQENGAKLAITDFYTESGWLYVSYDGALRKYMISDIEKGKMPSQQAVSPIYSDMTKDVASHIVHSDKYVFVAATESPYEYLANSKIFVFDKVTGEYLTSISLDTGNDNYDAAVRNMWTYGDQLYVTWNNAKGNKRDTESLACLMPDRATRYQSPLIRYNISSIAYGATLSPVVVDSNIVLTEMSHPYNLGGNSYYDEENKILYQGVYTGTKKQCYKTYDVSTGTPKLGLIWQNGSYDCVSFYVKDGYLYEILHNNAGLTLSGTTTQTYNKVLKYKLPKITGTSGEKIDLTPHLVGSYQTTVYGNSAISSVAVLNADLYIGTTNGIEIVDNSQMTLKTSITDIGTVYGLKLEGNLLFANTSQGIYLYDVSGEALLLDQYGSSVRSLSVDLADNKIYTTTSRAKGYGQILSYDKENFAISDFSGLILENIDYSKTKVSENYVFAYKKNAENIIYVYNRSTGLKIGEIDTESVVPPNLAIYGKCFYTFSGTKLNVYNIPSESSNLSSLLVTSTDLSNNITGLCFKDDLLYVATESGIVVLNIASASSGTLKNVTTMASGKKITALTQQGNYLYATTSDKNLFLYNVDSYTTAAQATVESSDVVTDIAASYNGVFCLTDKGDVLSYVPDADIVVKYNVDIKTPVEKTLSEVVNEKGFPSAKYKEKIYSTHSYVSCNDNYVVTSGTGGINIYNRSMKLVNSISASSAGKPYIFGDKMIALVGGKIVSYDLSDISGELAGTELATLSSGEISADSSKIAAYSKSAGTIGVYSHSGTLVGTLTDCPTDATKIYYKDGFVYCISTTTVRLYDVNSLSGGNTIAAETVLRATFSTATQISSVEAVGDYLYVATNNAGAAANKIFTYDLSAAKAGTASAPSPVNLYSSISANKGGKISAFARRGDFIIANAQDAGELQIINIKGRKAPYRESYVLKTSEDSASFSDIAVSTDRIYAISSTGGLVIYDYNAVDIASLQLVASGKDKAARVRIYNESGAAVEGTLIIAAYSEDDSNKLIDLESVAVTAQTGLETIAETPALDLEDYTDVTLKAFLFEGVQTLKPLCEYTQNVKLSNLGEVTIYVNPKSASNTEDGSSENPFKTIEAAKEYVRTINTQMSGDITVVLADGRYELTEPLKFDEKDSGFNGHKVIYKAANGATPILSGGRQITGWTLHDRENNIYSVSVPGLKTRQLIVDGNPAVRARSEGGLTNASHDNGELGIYCYDPSIADYKNIKDLELVFYGSFFSRRIGVDAAYKLDSSGKTLLALTRPFWQTSTDDAAYILPSFYENAYELLDKENEFYLDSAAGMLYYKPKQGVNIENSNIIAPILEEILAIEGSSYYNRVMNLEFSGIKFTDTTWLRPSNEGGFYPKQAGYYGVPNDFSIDVFTSIFEAVISMKLAENITVSSCEIVNAGGNGIRIIEAASDIEIVGNKFEDISGGGIYIGEVNRSDANPWDARRKISDITVSNNYINNIAREYYSSCALALGTGQNVKITNNEISNTPYTAIHIGWGWDNTRYTKNLTGLNLSSNYIHDVMQLLGDGGAIYATGITLADKDENPNIISQNYIERVDGSIIFAGSAIYLDTGASGYLIDRNVVDLNENNSAWIPRWGSAVSSNNRFENNYTSTARGTGIATNTTVVTNGVWPAAAVTIKNEAGLTDEYSYLKQ